MAPTCSLALFCAFATVTLASSASPPTIEARGEDYVVTARGDGKVCMPILCVLVCPPAVLCSNTCVPAAACRELDTLRRYQRWYTQHVDMWQQAVAANVFTPASRDIQV